MVRKPAETRQLSFEDTGVIGAESVESDVTAPQSDEAARAAARPADASAPETAPTNPANFEKEDTSVEDPRPVLPEGFEDWEGYKLANGSARDSFAFVIRYPGSVFRAAGRYHNAKKVDEFFDVEDGHIVPDGLYLIPTNYLVNREAQGAILGGRRAPERAPERAPRVDPLRSPAKRDER